MRQAGTQCAHCPHPRRVPGGPATELRGMCAARRENRGECAFLATGEPPMCTLLRVPSRPGAHYPPICRTLEETSDRDATNVHISVGSLACPAAPRQTDLQCAHCRGISRAAAEALRRLRTQCAHCHTSRRAAPLIPRREGAQCAHSCGLSRAPPPSPRRICTQCAHWGPSSRKRAEPHDGIAGSVRPTARKPQVVCGFRVGRAPNVHIGGAPVAPSRTLPANPSRAQAALRQTGPQCAHWGPRRRSPASPSHGPRTPRPSRARYFFRCF